jgi:4-hydroxythreonine-4-phosphate dehydrogenase
MTPRLAVTLGDPRGIGPEIVRAALATPIAAEVTVVGPEDLIADLPVSRKVGVGRWEAGSGEGSGDRARMMKAGKLAGHAIEAAARLVREGEVDGVVTAPIEKRACHLAGFTYPGHTEWLGALAGAAEPVMMLASDRLRVVLITTHLPLRDVPVVLTADKIVRVGKVVRDALIQRFGIAAPRLALCALNPHAGEGGLFGDEEERILRPAAAMLDIAGPIPADTVFVRAMRGEFDAVLAPYHDVGMTAIKVASFGEGVNITLGLPYVRTSPDHGTAFDIAGTGTASASSMRKALEMAVALASRK